MRKIEPIFPQWIKCLFGFHEWLETTNIDGDMSRECIHCKKTQLMYKGDWY